MWILVTLKSTMRANDCNLPLQQDEYEGLIDEVVKEDSGENQVPSLMFPFGISSLVNKREPLQIGDKV